MNYLAHLFLAEPSADSMIGNLLGDFIKGPVHNYETKYNPDILQGIITHRQIDYFTDRHRICKQSKQRINPNLSRYSGIIIDICYDHFLSCHWNQFTSENLNDFINHVYLILQENQAILPANLQKALPSMISQNWLKSYQEIAGIDLTFHRISKRLTRKNNLAMASQELINNYRELEADFLTFFPELINYVQTLSTRTTEMG